ncbi:hypothetical protein [Serratia marcescens]|uniref:hypothetical protein n=1 Tax=Serratia marcescens TaxID=615 RepID=UPI00315AFAA1
MTLTTTEELKHLASSDNANELTRRLARECLANREAQPVAYAVFADNGNIRIWSTDKGITENVGVPVPLYTAPPAPANAVAWEMRYWNSGYNMWHDWERITAEQHAEMSVQHATNNDYEFRVLYDAPSAPAVPDDVQHLKNVQELYHRQEKRLFALAQRIKGASFDKYSHTTAQAIDVLEREIFGDDGDACRAAMLAAAQEGGN